MVLRPFFAPILLVALVACSNASSGAGSGPTITAPPGQGEAGIVPTAGPVKELEGSCVNGFTNPPETDPLREEGLRILARAIGDAAGDRVTPSDFAVEEMRYFEGPESPPSEREYILNVRRWYVKATLKEDEAFAGRYIVERRTFGPGLAAVAPFDSQGFASPDWVGFQYEGEDAERGTYDGLPGTWGGTPYDFVRGKSLDGQEDVFGFPGLPVEVIGCLAGT